MPEPETRSVPARDGYPLATTIYPAAGAGRPVVLISAATGVPRRFYRRFATYLAQAGFTTITYDYRGVGDSRPEDLRGFEAHMRDWALLDMAGMIDWIQREWFAREPLAREPSPPLAGGPRLFLVGHSFGGQAAGLLPNAGAVDGMVTASSQSGYWRLQGGAQKVAVAIHMAGILPLLARAVGYVPWKRLGGGEDLPRGVALEWARWCRDPRYLFGDESLPLERYAGFEAPILAYSIADDDWGTRRAVDTMMAAYPNVERRHVAPEEVGVEELGHFGFFRPRAKALWEEVVGWLRRRL